ncbi:UNVERIFIED_CONTAM: hypothetical protein PYX00_002927 [Menopon gallinae]|uniref:Complementary sex determination N-terminal domain-containing protein n=1 Tax=Menopon gallinae TaxID=328185 RepID=A0AAW2HY16_9NEOP
MRRSRSRSPFRRSQSPCYRKRFSPPRRHSLGRSKRDDCNSNTVGRNINRSPKRDRMLSTNRNRSPPRQSSRERRRYISDTKPISRIKRSSSSRQIRDRSRERFCSEEKYDVVKPSYSGPEKDIVIDRDDLKKIVVNIQGVTTGNDNLRRDIVNPEEIRVVRREGEGSRPIFDREDILINSRGCEDYEVQGRRRFSPSPARSGRRRSSEERFRRRSYSNQVRSPRRREYNRERDDRSRYRSSRRNRSERRGPSVERIERYDDSQRHSRRGRSAGRPSRRGPGSSRGPSDDYAGEEYPPDEQEYYEVEYDEHLAPHPVQPFAAGALPVEREYPPPVNIIRRMRHPIPPVQPAPPFVFRRPPFLPRPRVVIYDSRPMIRVAAPIIPIKHPFIPVRCPPIIPIRPQLVKRARHPAPPAPV